MKTSVRRTPQQWIELRQIEQLKTEQQRGKTKPAKLFLVPERADGEARRQLEFGFDRPEVVR
jgi:hypothetical protein